MPEAEIIGDNPDTAYEPSDVAPKRLGWLALGVVAWLAVVPLILAFGYPRSTLDAAKAPTVLPPEPRQQIDPHADLMALRAEKEHLLTSYGWVDRGKGIARIPIDEAMKRLAAQGIPGWPGGSGTNAKGEAP